jgi:hypothetical protein
LLNIIAVSNYEIIKNRDVDLLRQVNRFSLSANGITLKISVIEANFSKPV